MTYGELIKRISTKTGLNKNVVRMILTALKEVCIEAMAENIEVGIPGLFKIYYMDRREHKHSNPRTQEMMVLEKTVLPRIKLSKQAKDLAKPLEGD